MNVLFTLLNQTTLQLNSFHLNYVIGYAFI